MFYVYLLMRDQPRPSDHWAEIRPLIDGFNNAREKNFEPGKVLCVDECMSAWRGKNGKYCVEGMPHVTKIIRKPEGVGAELKSIGCGESGILLRLELIEGSEEQKKKDHYAETQSEGTAVTARLSEPWFNTKRVVVADSAFSSIKTCKYLASNGLYFMGMVKTARKEFPVDYFKQWIESGPARGEFCMLCLKQPVPNPAENTQPTSSIAQLPIYACCWNDRKAKCIVSNCGDSTRGTPSSRRRHRIVDNEESGERETVRYNKVVERPQMIELFFNNFNIIDVHDHFRQGSLAIEKSWKTQSWWHRVFSTVIAMCIVDAYLMYRYESESVDHSKPKILDFADFRSRLAYQMIHQDNPSTPTTRSKATSPIQTVVSTYGIANIVIQASFIFTFYVRICRRIRIMSSSLSLNCPNIVIKALFAISGAVFNAAPRLPSIVKGAPTSRMVPLCLFVQPISVIA